MIISYSRRVSHDFDSSPDAPAIDEHAVLVRTTDLSVDLLGHPVLRDVQLIARAGEVAAIVGPNGSGKSTLVETIAGVHRPRAGRVELAPAAAVALVPQRSALSPRLPITVGELVAMGRWRHAGAWRPLSHEDRAIVADALATVGLTELRRRPVAALSGGQRQRALLAQGLAQRARVLLLDEPMTALDVSSKAALNGAILATATDGAAVIVVTHDLHDLARVDAVVRLG